MNFREYALGITEAKMTNEEIVDVLEKLVKTGDDKAKEFAQGLLDYYKENGSFHPNQVAGLQNIMKNASFQLAENNLVEITTKEGERESTIISDPATKLTVELYDVDDIVNLIYNGKTIDEFDFDEFKVFIKVVNEKIKSLSYNR